MTKRLIAFVAFLLGLVYATFSELQLVLPALLHGAIVTVEVAALAILVCTAAAFAAGVGRLSPSPLLRWPAAIYVEIFRGTSLLVILFWFYFVLPEFGITLSAMEAAVLGVGLNYGAYGAEIVRGAVKAVPRSQVEACTALNMRPFHRLRRVIVPQALVTMIPSWTNLMIELTKGTSLVAAVTLVDITYASVQQNQLYYRTVEIFMATLIMYYLLSQFIRLAGAVVEHRATRHLKPRLV